MVAAFEAADVQLALRRQQLEILQRRTRLLQSQHDEQLGRVERLRRVYEGAREALGRHLASLYRLGPLSYGRLLFAADDAREVLVGYQLMTYLAARDRDLVASVRGSLTELTDALHLLAETDARLQGVRAEAEAAIAALAREQEQRRAALARLDTEAEARRNALEQARRAALRLEQTLAGLQPGAAAEADAEPAFAAARGSLPWPADGPVVGNFGRRRHPVYDTTTLSRGIEIGAPEGAPVRAVFDGKVAFADWYTGYGLLVILEHGGGYFTLYGHLERVEALVNQQVRAGAVIGRVGRSGSLTGPNLYFEVREGTDALDPLRWLRPRRRP